MYSVYYSIIIMLTLSGGLCTLGNMSLLKKLFNLLGCFTGIPNGMIENVLCKYNLPKREIRIFFALARETWGWQKQGEYMTQREIAEKTGINPGNMSKVLKSMVDKCIIITRNGKKKTYFEINRDYMTWRLPERDGLFSEALKLSTNSRTGTPDEVISREGNFYEKDNTAVIPRDENIDIPRDNMSDAQRRATAYFEGRVKNLLKKF